MFDNRLVAKLFENRGWTADYVQSVDNAGHGMLLNADKLVDALDLARNSGYEITLLSDFDMDGIMAGVIGFAGLAEMGFRVNLYIPEPANGYGFKPSVISDLISKYPNTDIILTSDTGISQHSGVDAVNAYGIDIYITDHHEAPERPVNAKIIVDPMQEGESYQHPSICGAYVLYQVIKLYADRYAGRETQEQIRRLRVFAGIGTISDSMPLLYENRQLVRDAVAICRMVFANNHSYLVDNIYGCAQYQAAFRGLFAVLKLFASAGKITDSEDINEEFLGFYVAPMFNAVKRVGRLGDMARVYGVFFGFDPDGDAAYLYRLNNERKTLVADEYAKLIDCKPSEQPYAPYIYLSDARPGVLGLLAQKIVADTQQPCCVICNENGHLHGSGRSPEWYPFKSRAMNAFAPGQAEFRIAGHQVAFGVGFDSWRGVTQLTKFLETDAIAVRETIDAKSFKYVPDFVIAHDGTGDTVIDVMLFVEFMDELKKLGPFGSGFRKPDILLKFHPNDGEWVTMGTNRRHLKIKLPRGFDVVLFNQGSYINCRYDCDTWYVRGELSLNEYRGIQTVQFMGDFISSELVGAVK